MDCPTLLHTVDFSNLVFTICGQKYPLHLLWSNNPLTETTSICHFPLLIITWNYVIRFLSEQQLYWINWPDSYLLFLFILSLLHSCWSPGQPSHGSSACNIFSGCHFCWASLFCPCAHWSQNSMRVDTFYLSLIYLLNQKTSVCCHDQVLELSPDFSQSLQSRKKSSDLSFSLLCSRMSHSFILAICLLLQTYLLTH